MLAAADPLSARLRAAVGDSLDRFLAARADQLAAIGPECAELLRLARGLTAGGKRLRPAFLVWGFAAVRPPDDLDALVNAAASLDLLHVSALVHDDVMDDSATRRGAPAAHVQLARAHASAAGRGASDAFGRAGAILLGDLLVMWSDELYSTSGLPAAALAAGRPLLAAMRTEVTCGQFLDVTAQTRDPAGADALADAERVVEFKTARYTVVRPVQLGAALAGAPEPVLAGLAAFGSPLGRAFQYRDDLLGVFGDEARTGKPAGDDLREGKRTVLVAQAMAGLAGPDRTRLAALLGDADLDAAGLAAARRLLTASGAVDRVEAMITAGHASALAALEGLPITAAGRAGLTALARAAVERDA